MIVVLLPTSSTLKRGPYSGGEGSDIALNVQRMGHWMALSPAFAWSIFSQSVGTGTCTLLNASSLTLARFIALITALLQVRLTATDDDGASSYDDASVTINNVATDD